MSPKNLARFGLKELRKLAVVIPGACDSAFVNGAFFGAEIRSRRRHVSLRTIQPHVALALLLGIVKRVCVQQRPNKLPADVFKPEFKMCVLINRVMPAVVRRRANVHALLFGYFFWTNQARRIASARRGNRRIERMRESIAQRDAWRRSFDDGIGRCAGRNGHVCSH